MANLKHYNPDLVDFIFGGVPISGYAEDGMIEIEEEGERFVLVKGTTGEVARSKTLARVAKVTLKLLSTSDSNDVLSAAHILDTNTEGGGGVVTCGMLDRNGRTAMVAPQSYVDGIPPIKMGSKAEERTWKLTIVNYKLFLGGT
jgi:hypothetical protein